MISIDMIITALLSVTLAKGSMECNVSESVGPLKCFGALGDTLMFHLPMNTKYIILKKENISTILNLNRFNTTHMKVTLHEKYIDRCTFFKNGTLKMNNARRTDSGQYRLQTHGPDGIFLYEINIHLEIQASVSKPTVSQMCLSPAQMNISCSWLGDGVEFSLTLDEHLLMQTGDQRYTRSPLTQHSVSNITIGLHGQLTGNLMCNVQNYVSKEETVIHLSSCQGSASLFSLVAVAVISSVVTLLLSSSLYLCIKHFNKKARAVTADAEEAEDEIVYSDVRVMKHTRKSRARTQQHAA